VNRKVPVDLLPLVGFAPAREYHPDHMSDVRRRQGWVVVAACSLVMFGVWNSHAGFGVFLPVLANEFGWSRGAISVAPALNLIIGGLIAFFIGAASDRYGPRRILTTSAVLVGALFALASRVDALWQLYAVLGVLLGIAMSSVYLVPTTTVSRWFVDRRGLALGILLAGLNLAFVTGPRLSAFLIERVGWRSTYLVLGALVWILAIPGSMLTRFPPAATGADAAPDRSVAAGGSTIREALADRRLWLLVTAWMLLGFNQMMISIHLVSYVKDQGVTLERAALALTILGTGTIAGRILIGMAADRVGTKPTFWFCLTLQVVTLVAIIAGPALSVLDFLLFWLGLSAAGTDTTLVKGAVETFGVRAIGAVMGVLSLGWRCGAALGPTVAGFIYDVTGTYVLAFSMAAAGLALSSAFFTLGTSAPPERRGYL
jgi:MFS transporter, OFA family, oxalate/formate antiporter